MIFKNQNLLGIDFVTRNTSNSVTLFRWLVQDCSISIANALEILQSSTKPSISSLDSYYP